MQSVTKKREKSGRIWFLMLLGCILSIGTAFAQSAGTDKPATDPGKRITYQCNNEQLSTAIRQIERLSGYYKIQFAYDDVEKYKITVQLKDASVEKAMTQLLKNTDLRYEINGRFVHVFTVKRQTDKKTIRGAIRDTNGEPLEGAAILNKAENNGTITDMEGNFVLPVRKETVTLVITYVGKKPLT